MKKRIYSINVLGVWIFSEHLKKYSKELMGRSSFYILGVLKTWIEKVKVSRSVFSMFRNPKSQQKDRRWHEIVSLKRDISVKDASRWSCELWTGVLKERKGKKSDKCTFICKHFCSLLLSRKMKQEEDFYSPTLAKSSKFLRLKIRRRDFATKSVQGTDRVVTAVQLCPGFVRVTIVPL